MGGTPCKAKIILNGLRVQTGMEVLLSQVEDVEIDDDHAYKIIAHLNDAEDSMNKATKAFLDSQGYDGPVDHSLDFKE